MDKSKTVVTLSAREKKLSEKVARLMKTRDIGLWDFVTTQNPFKQFMGAGKLAVGMIRKQAVLRHANLDKAFATPIPNGKEHDWVRANRNTLERMQKHAKAISFTDFLRQIQLTVRTQRKWEAAKKANDFKVVEPHMAKLAKHMQKIGKKRAKALGLKTPYEGLMDELTPGLTEERLTPLFEEAASFSKHIGKVLSKQSQNTAPENPKLWKMDKDTQEKLVNRVVEKMGFDFENGGQTGQAAHPLCLGTLGDIRMTLRYNENNFMDSVSEAVHETGHALYRQNLTKDAQKHPVGMVANQALDESMSLLMANHVGHSKEFCTFMCNTMKEMGLDREGITPDSMFKHINRVSPGTHRLSSDEVHYPIHVKMRYDLGRKLVNGGLEPKDLPKEWNKITKKELGKDVKDDKSGCMQDIHWYGAQFGYFPNYFCGMLASTQIMEKARKDIKDLGANIEKGNLKPLVSWLSKEVYHKGSKENLEQLVQNVTGKPLSVEPYKNHIFNRYVKEAGKGKDKAAQMSPADMKKLKNAVISR